MLYADLRQPIFKLDRLTPPGIYRSRDIMSSIYHLGQKVRFTSPVVGRPGASGIYDIVRILPLEREEQHYRIKNESETYERVVRESQLELAD